MCGIWASLGLATSEAVIERVAHRGPDGSGWQEFDTPSGPLTFAHRRLAIFDTTENGHQPMSLQERPLSIVYNGAIYNFIEIRKELEAKGIIFQSNSDTEVLLQAYAAWGPDCLTRLNGMFAFVIWDGEKKRLFAARDRFGVKPLYFWNGPKGFALASEIKQITALDGFKTRINPDTAYDFLAFGQLDHRAETFFSGVHQLRGGECLLLELEHWQPGAELKPRRWYELPSRAPMESTAEDASDRLRELLTDGVEVRLRSDVDLGFSLSGGLDSSSIVSIAANSPSKAPRPLRTFSACFDDPIIDESAYVKNVVAHTGAESTVVRPSGKDLPGLMEKIIYHHDSPFTGTSMIAQWLVFEAARKAGVSVMLSGQGADEHLCGYHSSFAPYLAGLVRRGALLKLVREMAGQRRNHDKPFVWQLAATAAGLLPPTLRRLVRHGGRHYCPDWMTPAFAENAGSAPHYHYSLSELMRAHMTESSLPGLLHYEDRNSMAHGIESRLPFLDYRVVELSLGLDESFKIVDGETKWLLRQAMQGVLPEDIRTRQDKIGFATPEQAWLKGDARPLVEEGLKAAAVAFPDFFNAEKIRGLAEKTLNGSVPFDPALWRIACFGMWGRVFKVSG